MARRIVGRALLAGAGVTAFLAGISFSLASTLAYEDFGGYRSYEEDTTGLQGRIVPNGFSGNPVGGQNIPGATTGLYNWVSSNAWGSNRARATDLAYGNLIGSGAKHFEAWGGGTSVQAVMDTADFPGMTGTGTFTNAIGATGNTLYISFLYRIEGDVTANSQAIVNFQEQTAAATFSGRFQVGQSWNAANVTAQGTQLSATVDHNVHMILMKVVYNGTMTDSTDQVSLWYDPNLAVAESSQTPFATYTRNMSFTHIQFNGQGTASTTTTKLSFDELRFGTSWSDVAPVPEPGSLALAGFSAGLLIRRRRA